VLRLHEHELRPPVPRSRGTSVNRTALQLNGSRPCGLQEAPKGGTFHVAPPPSQEASVGRCVAERLVRTSAQSHKASSRLARPSAISASRLAQGRLAKAAATFVSTFSISPGLGVWIFPFSLRNYAESKIGSASVWIFLAPGLEQRVDRLCDAEVIDDP